MLKVISKTMHEIQFKYSSINEVDSCKNFSKTTSPRKKSALCQESGMASVSHLTFPLGMSLMPGTKRRVLLWSQ